MMYKDKTNTVFSVQCGVKGLQDTLHFTTEFKKKKKHFKGIGNPILIETWKFSFITFHSQYLRRVYNYLLMLIFNDNVYKDIHREKRL